MEENEMKEKKESPKDLFFVGDIHGELRTSVWELVEKYKISNANIIYCGDFGVGFGKPEGVKRMYEQVEPRLEKHNLNLWAVRGNHDNPEYFDGFHNFPRLVFLQDHVPIILGDYIIYPIGGATSVDRKIRKSYNSDEKYYGSSKRYWWPGEMITRKYTGLPSKVDIVVSHSAPIEFPPYGIYKDNQDPRLYDDCLSEREYLGWILNQLRPSRWFHGHFHQSTSGDIIGTLYRGLGINEVFMLPLKSELEDE